MSERCFDAMECRPEDLRSALSIHTQKITDSCRDKDCIEDLRVYLTRESQAVLDAAAAAKVRSAELVYTAVDVSPLAFHRNHYAIDLTFYYKVIADAAVGPCRPAAVCGLALFSKRAVLCGENSGAHIFRSDCPGNAGGSLPTAVVEVMDTNSQVYITTHIKKIPHFSQEKWGILKCYRPVPPLTGTVVCFSSSFSGEGACCSFSLSISFSLCKYSMRKRSQPPLAIMFSNF